jgi:tetratricopeptide (TPR) repeat protein
MKRFIGLIAGFLAAGMLWGAAADVDALRQQVRKALRQARSAASTAEAATAEDAVRQALRVAPDDFELRKMEVEAMLARHRYAEALERAKKLNQETPDDVLGWGLVADAAMALGDYDLAEKSAQWMLRLRSTNVAGLERGARLREVFGDIEGARQFWESSVRLELSDDDERAWIVTEWASLNRRSGRLELAEQQLGQVLAAFPDFQPAVAETARLRMEQHKYAEAVTILEGRYKKVARPDVEFELACALKKAGREADAEQAFADFEKTARAAVDAPYNYNRELIVYYSDLSPNPAEAVRLAKLEAARRQDVETLDLYAWALNGAGEAAEARKQIDKVLAVGVKDARVFYHAGMIAAKLKDTAAAEKAFHDAVAANPDSDAAEQARAALKQLTPHAS